MLRQFEAPTIQPGEQADVDWIAEQLSRKVPRLVRAEPQSPRPWWTFSWLSDWWSPRLLPSLAMAMAAVLIGIGIGLQFWHRPGQPFVPAGGDVLRSNAVEVLAPLGDLSRRPAEFRWQPVNGAAAYTVRLQEIDNTEIWVTKVTQASVSLPPNIQGRIIPGKTLVWQVTAESISGAVIAESGPRQFRFRAETAPR
jgi:hypothetical protein